MFTTPIESRDLFRVICPDTVLQLNGFGSRLSAHALFLHASGKALGEKVNTVRRKVEGGVITQISIEFFPFLIYAQNSEKGIAIL